MNYIDKIKEYAHHQLSEGEIAGIGFDHLGQRIIDPWMDTSARRELSTEKAFSCYGPDKMLEYIEDVAEEIGLNDKTYPVEGYPITTLNSILGEQVRIVKHGINDYAACFIYNDCSVRGTKADIADEVQNFLAEQKKQYCIDRIKAIDNYTFGDIFNRLIPLLNDHDGR